MCDWQRPSDLRGYFCHPCWNAAPDHRCQGAVVIGGRLIACTCGCTKENADAGTRND